MEEWKEYKLGEIFDFNNGLSKGGKFFGHGYDFVSFKTVFKNHFLPNTLDDLVESSKKEREKFSVKEGDVFLTRTSETQNELAYSCVALKDYPNATYNGFTKRLRPNGKIKIDSIFSAYFFRSAIFRNQVTSMSNMVTRASLSNEMLDRMSIKIPSYDLQKTIGKILFSFDAKIQLNKRINDNLEQQAQALFKAWFVDFEPFRGGKFVDSELGMIPEGWNIQPISSIFNFQEGPGIRNWQYVNNGTKFINIRCINNDIINIQDANMISDEEAQGKYAHFMLKENDIVISCSGTLGRKALVLKEYLPLCLNTSVIRFTPRINRQLGFLYGYLGSSLFLNKQIELASGSVQANFGPIHLKGMSIAIPDNNVLNQFSDIVNSIIQKKKNIISESLRLTNLRDSILPKLMSGKIKIDKLNS
ncbi:restriction endonuclease subunit S [Bacteroides acidifaciens]|uniref:restriction endonuclease subunit S n=3 Tax=Bacteroides acidifaciens TaxID=85831 RepID=UPI001C3E9668|nr:restriction endonuclease subunit S [Bacteroides acidifaciens]